MNKSSEKSISCSSGLTNRQKRNSSDKLKVSKGDLRHYKGRTIYHRKELLEDSCVRGGATFRPETTKEGRVHGGISLLQAALKAEKEGLFGGDGYVYEPNPLEARLVPVSVSGTEGRVHGGDLLALLAGNGGHDGFRN
jgi:hypothetical protein